ncbi:MAG: hypothetical protein ACOC4K_00375 [Verrucomicrobiota bacterium]
MKPIDFRNETFASIEGRITGQREATLRAWQRHGPCTTEELAHLSGLSILTLRPRTTELYQMGYVRLAAGESEGERGKHGGVYRAATPTEAAAHFAEQRRIAVSGQAELSL